MSVSAYPYGTIAGAGAVTDALNLDGHTIQADTVGSDAQAELTIDQNGNVYSKLNTAARIQIDTAADWVRPTGSAPGTYEVRYTGLTGDALSFNTAAENVWYALSTTDYVLRQADSTTKFGGTSSTFTVEIREGSSGAADVTGSYSLIADRDDF